MELNLSQYRNPHTWRNKIGRLLWALVWGFFCRPSPKIAHGWRIFWLRRFGANIGKGCTVHSSCCIWAPWNLVMGDYACLAHDVDCYNVNTIRLGQQATVSQYSYLCSASHDISSPVMRLTTAPIKVGNKAWIAAGAFVGPGVAIEEGAVVGARAVVTRDVPAWTVVAGNPARKIGNRNIRPETTHD